VPNLSISCPTNPLPNRAASGASSHEFHTPLDLSLSIRGVYTSSIHYAGDRVLQTTKLPEIIALCQSWQPRDVVIAPHKYGGTLLDAYWSTLVVGFTKEAIPLNVGSAPSMGNCRSFFHKCVRGE